MLSSQLLLLITAVDPVFIARRQAQSSIAVVCVAKPSAILHKRLFMALRQASLVATPSPRLARWLHQLLGFTKAIKAIESSTSTAGIAGVDCTSRENLAVIDQNAGEPLNYHAQTVSLSARSLDLSRGKWDRVRSTNLRFQVIY